MENRSKAFKSYAVPA